MSLKVLEIHHHAMRAASGEKSMQDTLHFYRDVMGMEPDSGRPNFRDAPGYWFNVGDQGQVHLISLDGPSSFAQGPGKDPTVRHIAFAVASIAEAKAEVERLGMPYWSLVAPGAPPHAEMLFLNDPTGNMVELHQIGSCRCNKTGRLGK